MSSRAAAEFFAKGKEALLHDHTYLARVCLEQAVNEERTPSHCSYFALALATSRGEFDTAIKLAIEAMNAEPDNALHYLHLGRIYLAAGRKREAVETFRAGLKIDGNLEILRYLEEFGARGRAVCPWLPREHPLNKYLGLLFTRLGLRRPKQT